MNKKQIVGMWVGIVFTVAVVLYPPPCTGFLFKLDVHQINFAALFWLIFCIALVTTGLIVTLRTKKK